MRMRNVGNKPHAIYPFVDMIYSFLLSFCFLDHYLKSSKVPITVVNNSNTRKSGTFCLYRISKSKASRKHAYIILTPLNPTFI